MKRSEINRTIEEANTILRNHRIYLPLWANFSPATWKTAGTAYREIFDSQLGWDVTDFGKGDFLREGLTLFTLRNGNPKVSGPVKSYCEKIMVVRPGQITPTHFHWRKMEDIINRGGGTLSMQLWRANAAEQRTEESFTVRIDGVEHGVGAGEILHLVPGQSICFETYVYHSFWAEGDTCVVGEVSTVNDDTNDNRFLDSPDRYPQIEQDEEPRYCLCNEYPQQEPNLKL